MLATTAAARSLPIARAGTQRIGMEFENCTLRKKCERMRFLLRSKKATERKNEKRIFTWVVFKAKTRKFS